MPVGEAQAGFLAGAACVPITGTGRYGLGGPGRRQASGVLDDVYVRAIALNDGPMTVVLLAADVRGIPSPMVADIRTEVRRQASVGELHLLTGATGVMSGPDVLSEGRGCSKAYATYFRERAAEVALCAIESLQPASMLAATAPMPEEVLGAEAARSSPPLVALSFKTGTGMTISTLSILGCCPSVLAAGNTEVSADYLTAFHQAMEAARGGISVALPGAVGDQTARRIGNGVAAAREVGEALATPILNALGREQMIGQPRLTIERCHADLEPAATLAGRFLGMRSLLQGYHARVRTSVRAIMIGGVQLLTVPGAPTQAAVNQVHARMTSEIGAVIGCVDGMWGLLAPPETPSPYDVGETWPAFLAPSAWGVLRDTLPTV